MAGQLDLFPTDDIINSHKEKKTLIKETIIREYETHDEDGDRRIKRETEVKRWFQYDPISLKQNPTQSITFEVL